MEEINLDGQQDSKKNKKPKSEDEFNKTVPFYKLFSFADSLDHFLMFAGTIAAAGNGMSLPLMSIVLGHVIDAFGSNINNIHKIIHQVSKVILEKPLDFVNACSVSAHSVWFCYTIHSQYLELLEKRQFNSFVNEIKSELFGLFF